MSDRAIAFCVMPSTSPADLERRIALAGSGGRISVQDQLDWGEALLREGDADGARLLFQSAFIQQGFSRQLAAARGPLLVRAGLPAATRAPLAELAPGITTVEVAIAEVQGLARTIAPALADGLSRRPPRQRSAPGLHPTAVQRRGASTPSETPVSAFVGNMYRWLCGASAHGPDREGAAAAIEVLRGAENDPRRFSAAELAGAPSSVLAPAIALQALRFFLRQNSDLLSPPVGSLDLFHAVAAFDSPGLGPYFSNVGRIARRSANIFELARIAEAEAATVGTAVDEEAWVALLTRHLQGALLAEVIDDLGDDNAAFALHTILDHALALPAEDIDQAKVMRIRDAALDNLDYDLAARAQRALIKLKPGDMLELRILGTIDASNGHVAAADQSLSACLACNPADQELAEQVAANKLRRYAPFAIGKGFGSPHDRQLKRLRLRTARQRESALAGPQGMNTPT